MSREESNPLNRRNVLQIGSAGMFGISLPTMLKAAAESGLRKGAAKRCVLFFLDGGPGQQDMWDMKPDAPADIRGEFYPISSSVPGIQVCEGLPMVSQHMHHLTLIRSVTHDINIHSAATYYMLTGRRPVKNGNLIIKEWPDNFPPFGSVLSHVKPQHEVLDFIHFPEIIWDAGHDLPGQRSGFMGPAYDPLVLGDPSVDTFKPPGLALPSDISVERFSQRNALRHALEGIHLDRDSVIADLDVHKQKAYSLISSSKTRDAFDLSKESPKVRERYGLPDRDDRSTGARQFGGLPHLGQSLLLTRRLVEAGVRFVTLTAGRRRDSAWDGHLRHFPILRKSLLPYFDRGFSAFIEDMSERGLLEDTLLVVMGEFGRTPKIGQATTSTIKMPGGRDHWGHCFTVLMGGAGVKGGYVYGSSDKHAGYPETNPVTPEDVAATIYYALGIDPESHIEDALGRPHKVALGKPVLDIFS
ncbi:MAG: hypothetical protein CMP22_06510 [Rickettsiales bacterium]|nr:hypothetical protein [Rickettsiales bacterium]|tara:strand:+ start:2965 stop:4377 length:1413 start_codon:yes stop_codon:yes gene_type:complete